MSSTYSLTHPLNSTKLPLMNCDGWSSKSCRMGRVLSEELTINNHIVRRLVCCGWTNRTIYVLYEYMYYIIYICQHILIFVMYFIPAINSHGQIYGIDLWLRWYFIFAVYLISQGRFYSRRYTRELCAKMAKIDYNVFFLLRCQGRCYAKKILLFTLFVVYIEWEFCKEMWYYILMFIWL